MARGKKKEALTIEERLEAALVPKDEQPYEVPGNWCWVKLGAVIHTSKEKTDKFDDLGIKYVGLEHIEKDRGIVGYDNVDGVKSLKNIFHRGQLLYGKLRPYLNKHDVADFDGVCSTDILVFDTDKHIINTFVDYYFNHRNFIEYAVSHSKGINLPRVSESTILDASFPLPPEQEQQRIVERIESLFSQLDEARDKAQEVLDDNEARNAALYHAAFSGELTQLWRDQHGKKSEWRTVSFSEVAEIQCNLVDPAEYQDFPHIAPDNIEKRTGVLLKYHTIAEDKVTSGKHRFYPGQILYSKIRPYLSKVVMVDFDGLCSADMYPIKAKENIKFLFYQMLSDDFLEQASTAGSRSVLPKINQKELSQVKVNITSVEEQDEVVRMLDSILPKFQMVRESVEIIMDSIDLVKKSILAKAFRGELGTNDPRDESAIVLLQSLMRNSS